ncbi:hypothetical protein LL033_11940 [Clostridium estertheticum]|uniref:hypothetical protein n=1 Tax=Clostridium estertheticum TaxID=238834 RepID=UPI001C0B5DBA|nr:hypothetical protein [Clostridium estertheticum]MBU3215862.1 hypothetical protein [Clostridium estertheticum]WAG57818.1 hypothetical protein LL033_11940 [Clostridium estertheticum]
MPQLLNKEDNDKKDKELVALFLIMLSYKNSKDFKKLMIQYRNNRDILKDSIGKIYIKYMKDNKLSITNKNITKELRLLDKDIDKIGSDLTKQENIILGTLLYKTYTDTYNKSISIISKYKVIDRNSISKLIDKSILSIVNVKINGKTNVMRNADNKAMFINNVKKNIKKELKLGSSIEVINKSIDKVFQKKGIDITDRLIDNEISRMYNVALIDGYREVGIQRVIYCSVLEVGTCSDCANSDGEVFDIDDCISLPRHVKCNCYYNPEI